MYGIMHIWLAFEYWNQTRISMRLVADSVCSLVIATQPHVLVSDVAGYINK